MTAERHVVVVGAGIAGVACAREVAAAGLSVIVYERERRLGGRMAVRTAGERPVDVGASYFTVTDAGFAALVAGWERRGLARPWTDTFHVGTPDGLAGTTSGPVRWAAAAGLGSLVEELAAGLVVEPAVAVGEVAPGPTVDGEPARAVVLAMPDPQARDLLSDDLREEVAVTAAGRWQPALCLSAGWAQRCWPAVDGVFVNGSRALTWIADDGRRRGDGAPVLVAHSTAALAAEHQDAPAGAGPAMLDELAAVLGVEEPPRWAEVRLWSPARPVRPREEPFHLGARLVGLAGDGWHAPARVQAAYLSGRDLGRALARRLA